MVLIGRRVNRWKQCLQYKPVGMTDRGLRATMCSLHRVKYQQVNHNHQNSTRKPGNTQASTDATGNYR